LYNKRRNNLKQQKINVLVFVRYNVQLERNVIKCFCFC